MTDDATRPDDAWEGGRVQRWLRQAEALDRQMAPITEALFAAAALAPGERVVDVGCGAGPIARAAATVVGAGGSVVGVDVSAEMLAAAAAAPVADGAAPIEWVEADVVAWRAEGPPADAVVSRFGVMFFSDPTAAFTRLAEAAAPGGRLAVAVWQPRDRSEMFQVPLDAALGALRAAGVEPEVPPPDVGPFSFGREEAVRAVLDGTGWVDVAFAPHDLRLLMGGGAPPAEVARASLDLGPARLVTEGVSDDVRAAAVDAVAAALGPHVDADGRVVLGGSIAVVTARRA